MLSNHHQLTQNAAVTYTTKKSAAMIPAVISIRFVDGDNRPPRAGVRTGGRPAWGGRTVRRLRLNTTPKTPDCAGGRSTQGASINGVTLRRKSTLSDPSARSTGDTGAEGGTARRDHSRPELR